MLYLKMAPNPIISQIYFFVTSHFGTLLIVDEFNPDDLPNGCPGILCTTLVLEVFLDFSPHARVSCERAPKHWTHAKRGERKTSGHFGLESHFHADARIRIWPLSLDWLIFYKHPNQYDWSWGDGGDICYCTSWETILFAKCCSSQFI